MRPLSCTSMLRSAALVGLVVLAGAPGCRSAYYGVLEQVGVQKRHILEDRIEDGREAQQQAQEQFQDAFERFKTATSFEGGDLEDTYRGLAAELEESETRAADVRERIASIEQVAGDLFEEWEDEIGQISRADLRRKSSAQLQQTRTRYAKLLAVMKKAERKMEPVLVAFRDQVLFLKHNLNASAIASLETPGGRHPARRGRAGARPLRLDSRGRRLPGHARAGLRVASPRPSIRQLECAVAVADALHFGRAARACAITQPALSAQIQAFEELLGLRLFERGRRGVIVTTAGAPVIEQARAALAGLDRLVESAESQAEPLTGTLRLGVIPTVAPYLLPPLLPAVRRAWPKLRLVLREEQTSAWSSSSRSVRSTCCCWRYPSSAQVSKSWRCCATPSCSWPRPRTRSRAGAGRSPSLRWPTRRSCCSRTAIACARKRSRCVAGPAPRRPAAIQATSLTTLVQMVANGLGVTLLPERALASSCGRTPAWWRVPSNGRSPSRTLGLAWRPGAARAGEYRLLGQTLAAALAARGGKKRRA